MKVVLLLVASMVPVIVLVFLLRQAACYANRLWTAMIGLTLFHEVVLVVFPVWHSAFTDFSMERRMMSCASPEGVLRVMAGEAIFVIMFGVAFYILMKKRRCHYKDKQFGNISKKNEKFFLGMLATFGTIIYTDQFFNPRGYAEYVASIDQTSSSAIFTLCCDWFRTICWFPSIVACMFIFIRTKKEKYPFWLYVVAVIPLGELLLIGITAGLRGRITWVFSILVIIAFLKKQKKMIYIGLIGLICLLPIASFVYTTMRSCYYGALERGEGRSQLIGQFIDKAKTSDSFISSLGDIVNTASWRAQGPRNSSLLYELYDSGEGAGVAPYLGVIGFPVPRFIWAAKPIAGSSDGTTFGRAVYLVMRSCYWTPLTTMGPVLASAHAYWEGGWIWLAFAGVITGVFWGIILKWCDKVGGVLSIIVALSFCASLLIDGFLTTLYPLYSFGVSFWKFFIPLVVMYKATVLLFPKRKVI